MPLPPDPLPPLPSISLEVLEDLSPEQAQGFLRLVRRRMRTHYPDGSHSLPFVYDEVDRPNLDATVIAAHYLDAEAERWVYLRSALRPPVALRDPATVPGPLPDRKGGLWELPAGLVERHEQSADGIASCAARELEEELGFSVAPTALSALGPSTFPAPGVIAERHFFFEVTVDPRTRRAPSLDGSALEVGGVVSPLPLGVALEYCRSAVIEDAKTELALRRLAERYG